MKKFLRSLIYAALCLALCLYLPFLTGQIPQIGKALSPMHIPVLLCGFLCGWPYALAVGFIAPFLRFLLFHMPEMPMGIAMAFELAAYGLLASLLYRALPKKPGNVYVSLIGAMLGGRIVWGVARWVSLPYPADPARGDCAEKGEAFAGLRFSGFCKLRNTPTGDSESCARATGFFNRQ